MTGSDNRSIEFSLDDTPTHMRRKVWVETLNEFFYDYDSRLESDFLFGKIKGRHVADLSIARIDADAMSVWRTSSHITRDAVDGYFVLLPNNKPIGLGQRAGQTVVESDQFALVSTSDIYTFSQNVRGAYDNIIIPGCLLRQVAPRVDDAVAFAFGGQPIDQLFRSFSNDFCKNVSNFDPYTAKILARQAVELIGLVLDGADFTSDAKPIQSAHRRRIIKFIDLNFHRPECSLEYVSAHLKLSPRYIQEIFKSHGETLSDTIRSRRIREAYRLIRERKAGNPSITEIAFMVGFVSIAHFSRVFKEQIGHAPTHLPGAA